MNKAIIVGWINKGKKPDCGETVKNQLMIKRLQDLGIKCYQCDFKNWRKHPWVLLKLFFCLIFFKNATLILSTSAVNTYGFLKLLKAIRWKQNIVHWVIGGSLGQNVMNRVFDPEVISFPKHTLVESSIMKAQLESCNVKGVKQVPNFKPIKYYPSIPVKFPNNGKQLRLVFMSRIMPEKGCDYIIEAAHVLNDQGLSDKYLIDFYGNIAKDYKESFEEQISKLPNVQYCGFLDFSNNEAYDKLASYDIMLFPTYWKGEGFAGVFIDSFIAGVPMIASDWGHNKVFLSDGNNSIFIKPHEVDGLVCAIKDCLNEEYDLDKLAFASREEASKYDIENVIQRKLLSEIGII